jgi:hypothetical protein
MYFIWSSEKQQLFPYAALTVPGAFTKLRKAIFDFMSVRPSVNVEQLVSY